MATDDLGERVASAIDLIHSVRFVPGNKPEDPIFGSMWEAANHTLGPVHLRYFQKYGFGSAQVAVAVRSGVLLVVPRVEHDPR